MAGAGGGVFGEFSECVPNSDGTALAVVSFRYSAPSGQPIGAQYLVRLNGQPTGLAPLRLVDTMGPPVLYGRPAQRLFRIGKQELFIEKSDLNEIRPDGSIVRKILSLPNGAEARGLIGDRWLISDLLNTKTDTTEFLASDIESGQSHILLTFTGQRPEVADCPVPEGPLDPSSSYLLFRQRTFKPDHERVFTLHVPTGKMVTVPGLSERVVGPYVMTREEKEIHLFSAKTGKLVQRLKNPAY
jgi:hypothetical protein